MKIETIIFSFYRQDFKSLIELSQAMEVPTSHINQVMEGSAQIGHAFITGAYKAFPNCNFGDLFYLTDETLLEPAPTFQTIRRQANAK